MGILIMAIALPINRLMTLPRYGKHWETNPGLDRDTWGCSFFVRDLPWKDHWNWICSKWFCPSEGYLILHAEKNDDKTMTNHWMSILFRQTKKLWQNSNILWHSLMVYHHCTVTDRVSGLIIPSAPKVIGRQVQRDEGCPAVELSGGCSRKAGQPALEIVSIFCQYSQYIKGSFPNFQHIIWILWIWVIWCHMSYPISYRGDHPSPTTIPRPAQQDQVAACTARPELVIPVILPTTPGFFTWMAMAIW